MIFRRENRGDSFQRQISNLRQKQQDDASSEDEEQSYSYDSAESYEGSDDDAPSDTSRFSAEQSAAAEGISFPPARPESSEPYPQETTLGVQGTHEPAAPAQQSYQETRQWQAPAPSSAPIASSSDTSTSMISRNAYWNGTLRSEGSLQVHGKADGELHSETDLYVAAGAEVDASLHADSVTVAGLVRGKIEARSRLEVLPQGEVTGDVRSPKLVVHEGAIISGQLKMEEVGSGSTAGQGASPRAGES